MSPRPTSRYPVILAYLIAIVAAEFMLVWVAEFPGLLCHTLLIFMLLSHYALAADAPQARVLPVLALIPLARLLSLAVPTRDLPLIFWYGLAVVPLLLAIGFAARLLRLSWRELYLGMPVFWKQLLIALSGIPLALIARTVLRHHALLEGGSLTLVLAGTGLIAFALALSEELIYRGLLTRVMLATPGEWGVTAINPLYAAMMMGSFSWEMVLFAGLCGTFFSFCVQRTGSLWGVIIAHTLINMALFL
jgi:membrane protease YdiL (CAAX protease family)